MSENHFETRYEWLLPRQLRERQQECSLVIQPVGPLEYHGPHLPVGTDPINAAKVAHECCLRLGKGIVMPTMYSGTERERDRDCLKSLGFEEDDYIIGMDFPTRLWNSHYLPEEIFAILISSQIRILIEQGYKYIFIANGHGAFNQKDVLERLSTQYNHTMDVKVDFCLTVDKKMIEIGACGHADRVETSLMLFYNAEGVDLTTLPAKGTPFYYKDYSIVDGAGFTSHHDPEHLMRNDDPREGTAEQGKELFEAAVEQMREQITKLIVSCVCS